MIIRYIKTQSILIFFFMTFFLIQAAIAETEGIVWERFRLRPLISLSQIYTDNVFLENKDEKSDYITSILPKLALDIALATDNAITFSYDGDFRYYNEFDQLNNNNHLSGIFWKSTTLKGSQFDFGTTYLDSTFQSFSPTGRNRDFSLWKAYGYTLFQLGSASELGFKYDYSSRRMDNSKDKIDNFDENGISITLFYKSFPASSLLMEYAYTRQDNEDLGGPSTDMKTHTLFSGIRWEPTSRLKGLLKIGYSKTDFEEASDFSGFVTDIDLSYHYSEITTFILGVQRNVSRSTRAERETGSYVISNEGRLSIRYNKLEKMPFMLDLSYKNQDFEDSDSSGKQREDNLFRFTFLTEYNLMKPLFLYFRYRYNLNDSNQTTLNYRENRFETGLKFAL